MMLDLSNRGFAQAFHQGIFDVAQNTVHFVLQSAFQRAAVFPCVFVSSDNAFFQREIDVSERDFFRCDGELPSARMSLSTGQKTSLGQATQHPTHNNRIGVSMLRDFRGGPKAFGVSGHMAQAVEGQGQPTVAFHGNGTSEFQVTATVAKV